MPARLPESERHALHAHYDPIDDRNREISDRIERARVESFGRFREPQADPEVSWMDDRGICHGAGTPTQWDQFRDLRCRIHAELGHYRETPRLTGRWIWLRLHALSTAVKAKVRDFEGYWKRLEWLDSLESLTDTYKDEDVTFVDAKLLSRRKSRYDFDTVSSFYDGAIERIEPYLAYFYCILWLGPPKLFYIQNFRD